MSLNEYDIECIIKVKAFIDADIRLHTSIEALAIEAGIGQTKLKAGFKQLYGIAIFAYLRGKRMEQAGTLILTTQMPLKEIARLSGFKYYSNFIIAFYRCYGHTPSAYRKIPPGNHSDDLQF